MVGDCGAIADLEDKEGEVHLLAYFTQDELCDDLCMIQTALHKAALHGHLAIIVYLLSLPIGSVDVHARDADGWTPLHNACSKVRVTLVLISLGMGCSLSRGI